MPKFRDDDSAPSEQHQFHGHFGYSARPIATLGSSEFTLIGLVLDGSGSTSGFQKDLEKMAQLVVEGAQRSPRADSIMLRVVRFDSTWDEVHGFKEVNDCKAPDYDGVMTPGGSTLLLDTVANTVQALCDYGKKLRGEGFQVNAALYVVTDGLDTHSKITPAALGKLFREAVTSEALESFLSVLIGINIQESHVAQALGAVNQEASFSSYVQAQSADAKTLARVGELISKSISAQSQALGTGGPSQAPTSNPTF